ncbi:MAG: substrate-binding domain-containing protein [Mycobacterium sp.]|nr:substrate-binding domain-containing protein [Mycobacterium sp.]
MGRHRAPDPDEPNGEPSDDYSEPHDFGDLGGFPGPRYPEHPADDYPGEFPSDPGYFDYTNPSHHDESEEHHEEEPHPADVDTPDDFPDFPRRGPEPPAPPPPPPSGGHRGLSDWRGGHRTDGGRRGVSIGVIAALVAVVVVVAGVILWRFFGDALSNRSHTAAACTGSKETVAVIADPSIADHVQQFAERYNGFAAPVGDHCVAVSVKSAGSDAVVDGFIGNWPADLGQRPALWIPGSSVSAARLTAAAGKETITDSRSLVTSPVVLAVRPELQRELGDQKWSTLPGLQTKPDALAALKLPAWGSLRLALPLGGNSDAAYLAGEAVAAASAPPGAPPTDGSGAVRSLIAGQPKLADNTLAEAMNALVRPGDPATAPVHAVVTTEQQLFQRGESLPDAGSTLSSWLPPGPAAVADYPAVQLRGSWLSQDQVTAASGFAQFLHKSDQLNELAKAGFRVEGVKPPSSDVTSFAALPSTLSVGDDSMRATLANTVTTPSSGPAAIIMLEQSMTTEEGGKTRLGNVVAALDNRIKALPPNSVIGLWTFDGKEGRSEVQAGPLGDDVDGQPRSAALTAALDRQHASSGGAVSFTTLRIIYKDALANYQAGQTNSVLVITAGPHTDQSLGSQGLQDFIKENNDPAKPVAVNVIDFGSDSDRETWEAVAKLSGGSYQNLATSASPELATAVTNFLS